MERDFLPPQIVVTAVAPGRRDGDDVPMLEIFSEGRPSFALLIEEGNVPALMLAVAMLLPPAGGTPSASRASSANPVLRTYASGSFRWAVAGTPPGRPELSVALPDAPGLRLTLSPAEALAIGTALVAKAGELARHEQ